MSECEESSLIRTRETSVKIENETSPPIDAEPDEEDKPLSPRTPPETKYNSSSLPVATSPPHTSHPDKINQRLEVLKQTLNRTLLCYCKMQEHNETYPDDFGESEVEAITDLAVNLLTQVFAKQLVDSRNDKITHRRTINYLNIYYQLYKLKQIQTRRGVFFDEFSDVIEIGEMEEFFQETSEQFVEPIEEFSRQLDQIVNPPEKFKKTVSSQRYPSRSTKGGAKRLGS